MAISAAAIYKAETAMPPTQSSPPSVTTFACSSPRLSILLRLILTGFLRSFATPLTIRSSLLTADFLAAINGYEVIYFGLLTTALVFSPVLIGRQFVADRSLGDVQTINFLLANAQLDEAQKKEFWLQYLNKTIQTLDPRLDEDIKKYLETRKE